MSRPAENIRHAQETIRQLHEELEQTNREVMALTLELEQRLDALRLEVAERRRAESERQAQVDRLKLLNEITHAIGERKDLDSVFQVVIRRLEESLPIDFGCICLCDSQQQLLTFASVGTRSGTLSSELKANDGVRIHIDENGLSRCLTGELVYEQDLEQASSPLAQHLRKAGLRALVVAPLRPESDLFGVLIAARSNADSFSTEDRDFLRQLSEHVALAAHHAKLYGALEQAYLDLQQTQQTVMQQERLRALGQMASGIAHDINNSISPISLYTESLLENEPNLSERARGYLTTIARAIDDVARTVSRLREFYRQRETQLVLARVDLNHAIRQVIELTRPRWGDLPQGRGTMIDLRTELAEPLSDIMGAEHEIRDGLTNLIFNAVDAMPNGGVLTIRTRNVSDSSGSAYVVIEVSDTGIGMDEDTRRRCLEPFYTTKGERGTGLGLAMVYGMVQRHSAELEIESTPGLGTTLRLKFRAAAGPTSFSREGHGTGALVRRPLRVLLVDDDPLLIKSLQDTLQEDGHAVITAQGGQAGIDIFAASLRSSQPVDVVITDLGMPLVDGRKVASSVKALSQATPVILLTGWGQALIAANEIPQHIDKVLSKPPRLHELRAALSELLP